MPQLIDYTTFVANVNSDDLAMLTTFIVGVSVKSVDATQADALFVQAQRLYGAGLLTNLHRIYNDDGSGNLQQSFTGLVSPQAAGYVARLRARIKARDAAAVHYNAAVLAYQAHQRWEEDVRKATGVDHTTSRSAP